MEVVREVLKKYDQALKLRVFIRDGRRANVANKLATITGPRRSMLISESVVLKDFGTFRLDVGSFTPRKIDFVLKMKKTRRQ